MLKPLPDLAPRIAFFLSILSLGVAYGYLSRRQGWFPHPLVLAAKPGVQAAHDRLLGIRPWYYVAAPARERITVAQPAAVQPGPTLVAFVGSDGHQFIQVIESNGNVINQWRVDWFDLWPNADHLDEDLRPKSRPGAIVHGVLLLNDGSVVLQHDACGMVRLDASGHVLWRLAQRTHHSLCLDDHGHIWTSIRHTRKDPLPGLPAYHPPFEEYTIAEISTEGKLLQEVSIFDLLRENNLTGLLMMSSVHPDYPDTGGDTLHVNDVEVFPATMKPGRFQPGDVMVSIRGINAVVVFDLAKRTVRYLSIGGFVRQHDPDFIDGNTFSVLDNNHIGLRAEGIQSRVVIENAVTGERRVAFTGTPAQPFYTEFMGNHQWLPNGNLLLVETTRGRVFEVDAAGHPVWQFANLLEDGWAGAVSEGTRLPVSFTAEFFAARRAACAPPPANASEHTKPSSQPVAR